MLSVHALVRKARVVSRSATPRRLVNLLAAMTSLKLRRPVPLNHPVSLDVVLTKACNLRCVFCISYETVTKQHWMPIETFRRMADEMFPRAIKVAFCSGGEPLLYPYLREALEICRRHRITVQMVSNGMLLTEAMARWIVEGGLIHTYFLSFDGARPETLEKIRVGAKFDKILANMAALDRVKAELGRAYPEVELRYAAMRSNVEELPEIFAICARHGIRAVHVNYLNLANDVSPDEALINHPELTAACFARAREEASRHGINLTLPPLADGPEAVGGCSFPWLFMQIDSDGHVRHCYKAWAQSLGSVASGAVKIWHGDDYRKVRATMHTERPYFPYCRVCSIRSGETSPQAHDHSLHKDLYVIPELAHLSGGFNDRFEENRDAFRESKAAAGAPPPDVEAGGGNR